MTKYYDEAFCLVDPIFRGSRYYFDTFILKAARSTFKDISLITRTDFLHEKVQPFDERIAKTYPIARVKHGTWYESVPNEACEDIAGQLLELISEKSHLTIFFCGLNELGSHGIKTLADSFTHLPRSSSLRLHFIEYHPNTLRGDSAKIASLNFLARMVSSLRVWILDKSAASQWHLEAHRLVFEKNISIKYLPDPPPLTLSECTAVQSSKWVSSIAQESIGSPIVLAAGKQSPRKGILDLVRAARIIDDLPIELNKPRIMLSGELDLGEKKNEDVKAAIKKIDCISWRCQYVDDAEMLATYGSCDYVVIPYDMSFHGSSGVLAYATLLGKPVISTSHGCIGDRVKRFKLGYCYNSKDYHALAKLLSSLPDKVSTAYKTLQRNCRIYSLISTKETFSAVLLKEFKPELLSRKPVARGCQVLQTHKEDKGRLTKANTFDIQSSFNIPLSFV